MNKGFSDIFLKPLKRWTQTSKGSDSILGLGDGLL